MHRARDTAGRPVAVKVQYPGVREALTADVRTVSAMSRAAALVARGLALPPLVAELRERLVEELDYLHEGAVQTRFAQAYAGDPDVLVPAVHRATSRVLVMDWVDGTPLSAVARSGSQAERDRAAASTSASSSAARPAPACSTPTRTPATSACCPTAGSACSTSARPWSCRRCRRPSAA